MRNWRPARGREKVETLGFEPEALFLEDRRARFGDPNPSGNYLVDRRAGIFGRLATVDFLLCLLAFDVVWPVDWNSRGIWRLSVRLRVGAGNL